MALSNTITAVIPKILARGLTALRSQVMYTRLVNLDYSLETRKVGSTIDVPLSSAIVATNVTPAAVPSDPGNSTISTVQISLDNWQKTNFGLTDDDLNKIDAQANFIPLQMSAAFEGLASAINTSVAATYTGIHGYVGTAGTTPFGSGIEVASATDARKVLNEQLCPRDNRYAILDYAAEANALALQQFSDAEKIGSSDVKISGEIGKKFGINWSADDAVPTHTLGAAGTPLVQGASQTGTSFIVDGFTTKPSVGDVFTIAGDTQTYAVLASTTLAGTESTLTISPAIVTAPANNAVVTFKASHVVNLAFHRDAIALAMRAPDTGTPSVLKRANMFTMADPFSGLVFRLELIEGYKQVTWELDALWGTKLIRPELAVRIAG